MRLQSEKRFRDMALFNLSIDSKLRACDLLKIRVSDVSSSGQVNSRATIMQQKTLEITSRTRSSIECWIEAADLNSSKYLFPSRLHGSLHLSTRQYARIVESRVAGIGLDPASYGTHSLRRTKATLIYRRTKNLRANHREPPRASFNSSNWRRNR